MKSIFYKLFILSIAILTTTSSFSQNCATAISEENEFADVHMLKSKWQVLIVRGGISYGLEIVNDDKGVQAIFHSRGGITLEQDNEVIFTDNNKERRGYKFVDLGEMKQEAGVPVYSNTLQLDLAALEWFSRSIITTIYLKNNTTNEMQKLTVQSSRQSEFLGLARCYYNKLNKSKVKDRPAGRVYGKSAAGRPSGSTASSSTSKPSSSSSSTPPSSTPTRTASIDELNDKELDQLRQKLLDEKARLREEIAKTQDKRKEINAKTAKEIEAANEDAAAKKQEIANEVLESRRKAQAKMQEDIDALAKEIAAAKANANTEIEKLQQDVAEAKKNSAQKIQDIRLESAEKLQRLENKPPKKLKLLNRS